MSDITEGSEALRVFDLLRRTHERIGELYPYTSFSFNDEVFAEVADDGTGKDTGRYYFGYEGARLYKFGEHWGVAFGQRVDSRGTHPFIADILALPIELMEWNEGDRILPELKRRIAENYHLGHSLIYGRTAFPGGLRFGEKSREGRRLFELLGSSFESYRAEDPNRVLYRPSFSELLALTIGEVLRSSQR